MQKLVLKWLVVALTVLAIPHLVDGIEVDSLGTALALALMLGLLNTVLKPVLIFLTFPITLVSLGLFLFVINALVFWVSASTVSGVVVEGFGAAFVASLIVSFVSAIFSLTMKKDQGRVRVVFEKSANRSTRDVNPEKAIELSQDNTGRWS
jgi:putative membrane protein